MIKAAIISGIIIILIALAIINPDITGKIVVGGSKKYFIHFSSMPTQEDITLVKSKGTLRFSYKDLPVISAELSENALKSLIEKNKNIVKVEPVNVASIAIYGKMPLLGRQQPSEVIPWGIIRIKADQAWNLASGKNVIVAVLDTGIDTKHPDLVDNIAWCKAEIQRSCDDRNGHGTHVSGIIAALPNSIGVVGVSYDAAIYALQVCDASGLCYVDAIMKGIEDARFGKDGLIATKEDNARVVSMSFGGKFPFGTAFENEVKKAYSEGIVLVAAAGNDGSNILYPAAYNEVIAVGAIDGNNSVPEWSAKGNALELVAPGINVYSTYKSKSYATLSGTSMAAPHVSGTVALMLSLDQNLNPEQIRNILHSTATDIYDSGFDSVSGYGLVNAYAASFLAKQ